MSAENPLEGIAWPICPDMDESLPFVQKDDDYDTYPDDMAAARAVSKLTGTPIMMCVEEDAPAGKEWERMNIFVLPRFADLDTETPTYGYWCNCVAALLASKSTNPIQDGDTVELRSGRQFVVVKQEQVHGLWWLYDSEEPGAHPRGSERDVTIVKRANLEGVR